MLARALRGLQRGHHGAQLVLGLQQLVIGRRALGVFGLDHVEQLLVDLLLLLQQPDVDVLLAQGQVIARHAGADGQTHTGQQGVGGLRRSAAGLNAASHLAP